jgi:hypothetical protein
VEVLEDRTCLSAPQLTFSLTPLTGRMVLLSGQVSDENPATASVNFSGVVNGSVTPNATGQFSLQAEATGLGTVSAVAVDAESLSSNAVDRSIFSNTPQIQDFSVQQGPNKTVILSGRVVDESPGGLVVNFSGIASGSATTDANGNFLATLPASGTGGVNAGTSDPWGLMAITATIFFSNQPPAIVGFTASRNVGNLWTFSGTVEDEQPEGLVVRFGGLPSLAGKTAIAGAGGYFTITVELPPGENGIATAQTTDWFGLDSEVEEVLVVPI